MVRRSEILCTLIGVFAVCGCSSSSPTPNNGALAKPAASSITSSSAAAPSASAIASPSPSSSARTAATTPAYTSQSTAAPTFSMQCIGPAPAGNKSGTPRACILRGRIRAVKPINTLPEASWLFNGFTPPVANHAVDVDIAPDDGLACPTPLDSTAKGIRLPEADYADLVRAGRVRILGAERIATELVVGKRVCGWARFIGRPGLGYPTGWEGELKGGDAKGRAWKLLGAYSLYLSPSTNAYLFKAWSFTREGAAKRIPLDEGGAFIIHDAVRIRHGGQSAVSNAAAEVLLKASDGTFAVQATSDMTVGPVTVSVGQHDGFAFSAVRAEP